MRSSAKIATVSRTIEIQMERAFESGLAPIRSMKMRDIFLYSHYDSFESIRSTCTLSLSLSIYQQLVKIIMESRSTRRTILDQCVNFKCFVRSSTRKTKMLFRRILTLPVTQTPYNWMLFFSICVGFYLNIFVQLTFTMSTSVTITGWHHSPHRR